MWVESEVSKGSKFFFTITSQISQSSLENTLSKMSPFVKRTILFVDTLYDTTGVVDRIQDLALRPYVIHDVSEVADKDRCPHIDTIVVDSLSVVRHTVFVGIFQLIAYCEPPQTESIREYEHLRYIPIVLLAPSMPRLNREILIFLLLYLLCLTLRCSQMVPG